VNTYPVIREKISQLTKLELFSIYINHSYEMAGSLKEAYENEMSARKIDLPKSVYTEKDIPKKKARIDRETFISYVLLIYTITGLIYSWVYLIERVIRRDFAKNTKHKIIQSIISFIYLILEVLAIEMIVLE
jgi:hypothetical protein